MTLKETRRQHKGWIMFRYKKRYFAHLALNNIGTIIEATPLLLHQAIRDYERR